eukprot:g26365.t1
MAVRATKLGARLLHEGRIEESIRELHDARQLAPFSHIACGNLGCAYEAKNDVRAALYWYREAHRLQPVDGSVTCALALLEQRRGQAEEARHFLVTFLKEEPSHARLPRAGWAAEECRLKGLHGLNRRIPERLRKTTILNFIRGIHQ